MKSKTLIECIVVFTIIGNNNKKYISTGAVTLDGKHIAALTPDLHSAKPFEDVDAANEYISNINNPYNREFHTCEATLPIANFRTQPVEEDFK